MHHQVQEKRLPCGFHHAIARGRRKGILALLLAYIPGGRLPQSIQLSKSFWTSFLTNRFGYLLLVCPKMISNSLRNPAVAKGLCVFGIFLCMLIITKQIRNAPLLHSLRSSFLVKSLQERLEISEQIWEDSVTKRHAIYDTIVDPLRPM